ncbi:unnamed protein product [Brassica rapa subsp. narinosa]
MYFFALLIEYRGPPTPSIHWSAQRRTADYSRASEQQEADSAASKGCGIFEFLKKKPEDVPSSDVTKENKGEEKPSLAERIHLFDSSSSSDEESGENGEVKEKKRKKAEGEGVLSQQGR